MSEVGQSVSSAPVRRRTRNRRPAISNVVPLHQRILPRHVDTLNHWMEAGHRMGLSDSAVSRMDRSTHDYSVSEYILVWVRENIDPAYVIRPEGLWWVVTDAIRDAEISRTRDFAAALNVIRPVLNLGEGGLIERA